MFRNQVALFTIGLFLLLGLRLGAVDDSLRIIQLTDQAIEVLETGADQEGQSLLEMALCVAQNSNRLIEFYASIKKYAKFQRNNLGQVNEALVTYGLGKDQWRSPHNQEEWEALAWLYVNEGYTHARVLGNYADAVPHYEKAAQIFLQNPAWESPLVARFIYQYLGNIHTRLGDYSSAEILLKRSLQILLGQGRTNYLADNYSDLSTLYQSWERYDKAIDMLDEAKRLPGLGWHSKGLMYGNIGTLKERLNELPEANKAVRTAIDCFSKELTAEEPFPMARFQLASCYTQLASLLHEEGDTDAALEELVKARSEMVFFFGTANRREVGKLDLQMGNILLEAERGQEALLAFQTSLSTSVYGFVPKDNWSLPSEDMLRAENTINQALWGKGKSHLLLSSQEDKENHLQHALQCYELAEKGDRLLMQRYLYDDAKLFSLEEGHQRTEEAIDITLQLADITGDQQYLEKAFYFSESNRSQLLWEAFSKVERAQYALDETYQVKEKSLRDSLAVAEDFRYEVASGEYPDSVRNYADGMLMQAHQNYRGFLDTHAPTGSISKLPNHSLSELQEMLATDQALISYFPGTEHLFAFYLDGQGLRAYRLKEADKLAERVQSMRENIEQFQFNSMERDLLCQQYSEVGQNLYQQLLSPIGEELDLPEQLLIVPGGVLHYLPFAALLTEEPQQSCDFSQYPYLVHDHEVSLAYSANLHYELTQAPEGNLDFAGFAPHFKENQGWQQLLCSETRLADIAESMRGDYFGQQDASLANFMAKASDYGIIQLGTHAKANPEEANLSFIVFSAGEEGQYDSLFIKDMYALRFQAEMVALSACETAVGEIYQSEGVISLGRAFIAAGAKSVISSLWRVNESVNCDLLASFYQSLSKGDNKAAALRTAKLDYLASTDRRYAHPAYWAPFQIVGNTRGIKASGFGYWTYLLGGLALGFVSWLIWRLSSN